MTRPLKIDQIMSNHIRVKIKFCLEDLFSVSCKSFLIKSYIRDRKFPLVVQMMYKLQYHKKQTLLCVHLVHSCWTGHILILFHTYSNNNNNKNNDNNNNQFYPRLSRLIVQLIHDIDNLET